MKRLETYYQRILMQNLIWRNLKTKVSSSKIWQHVSLRASLKSNNIWITVLIIEKQEKPQWTKILPEVTPSSLYISRQLRKMKQESKESRLESSILSIWLVLKGRAKRMQLVPDLKRLRRLICLCQHWVMSLVPLWKARHSMFHIVTPNWQDFCKIPSVEIPKRLW